MLPGGASCGYTITRAELPDPAPVLRETLGSNCAGSVPCLAPTEALNVRILSGTPPANPVVQTIVRSMTVKRWLCAGCASGRSKTPNVAMSNAMARLIPGSVLRRL